jgi:hypothetical protein
MVGVPTMPGVGVRPTMIGGGPRRRGHGVVPVAAGLVGMLAVTGMFAVFGPGVDTVRVDSELAGRRGAGHGLSSNS